MPILIKGMKMPRDCWDCPCHGDDYWETVCAPLGRKLKCYPDSPRFDDCPLVPVPPHGRLIDADARNYTMLYKENWLSGTGVEAPAVWEKDIDNAPTIIPAEEGE